jgi:hypothetical protein
MTRMNVPDYSPTITVVESSLVDICDLLGAQRFELNGSHVLFVRHDGSARTSRWHGFLGDHVISSHGTWKLRAELEPETMRAMVA